ncbi:MAG TPA: site-2 protease family protein [Thermoleophilia bacterium]|nr:site-2 protease family protein [Thermoleophilia bacterium]
MNGIRVGRIFGIEVAIHPSWFIVLAFFAFSLATGFFPRAYPGWSPETTWAIAVLATLLLFASVLAHEFGHSLVARSQGIPVRNITLFILGGVAQLTREPDSPGREAWMAIAGPLVSVAIGVATLGAAFALPGPEQLVALLTYLGITNLALVAFNLLPGFPLDGGRVLRALLWRITRDRVRATTWAAAAGQVFAWGFIALGVAQILFSGLGGIWLILVGWMLIQAARATARQTLIEERLAGVPAARLMTTPGSWVSPYMTLDWVARDRLGDWDTRCLPVAAEDPDAEYGGLMCSRDLRRAARERYDRDRVRDVMTPAPEMPAVAPDTGAVEVLRLLRERESDRAVVVDPGGRLLGFIDVDAFTRFLSVARPRRRGVPPPATPPTAA